MAGKFLKNIKCPGFVIEMDGVRLYHAGDTDVIPETKEIEVRILEKA